MSDQERWIVYPLLLLALGVAMRDKITGTISDVRAISGEQAQLDLRQGAAQFDQLQTRILHSEAAALEELRCKRIIAETIHAGSITPLGDSNLQVDAKVHCRGLQVRGPRGTVLVEKGGGRIVLLGKDGTAQAQLAASEEGGLLSLVNSDRPFTLALEHFDQGSGLALRTPGGRAVPVLIVPAEKIEKLLADEALESRPELRESPKDPGPPEPPLKP